MSGQVHTSPKGCTMSIFIDPFKKIRVCAKQTDQPVKLILLGGKLGIKCHPKVPFRLVYSTIPCLAWKENHIIREENSQKNQLNVTWHSVLKSFIGFIGFISQNRQIPILVFLFLLRF